MVNRRVRVLKKEFYLHICDHWTNSKYFILFKKWMVLTKDRNQLALVEYRDLQQT